MISCILCENVWININLIAVKKKHLFTGIGGLPFVLLSSAMRVILILCL